MDFSDPAIQTQMDESLELFRENEFVREGTMSSWWEEMKAGGPSPGVRLTNADSLPGHHQPMLVYPEF